MFVLRGLDGKIVTSTEWGKEEKEEQYETYEQAQHALQEIEKSLPKGMFRIVALDCERCGGNNDVTVFHVNDEPKAFCQNCRVDLFARKNPVGRPSVGITKKVSLTLPENEWTWFEEKANGNRSQFLRHLVWEAQSPENEWNNYACLGYAIAGAKKLGYDEEKIQELVRAIYGEFDWKSVPVAEKIYTESDY
ncbi:MAG TPA: hypothetical protein IAA20_04070 [Candidatus Enterococcus avicola]|uniref:Uncharacterized protein n=1 Tax=Candidatus Enterococcus avicola TaxID=2838561 RepID=A0A9D2F6U7_9ENTE|nr:hypothetical protein [Candidatus Enterococcus avicola]